MAPFESYLLKPETFVVRAHHHSSEMSIPFSLWSGSLVNTRGDEFALLAAS